MTACIEVCNSNIERVQHATLGTFDKLHYYRNLVSVEYNIWVNSPMLTRLDMGSRRVSTKAASKSARNQL